MTKPQLLSHKHREIHYRAKVQVSPEELTSPSIDATCIKHVQAIVGAVLSYDRAVDKKILVVLNSIGTK